MARRRPRPASPVTPLAVGDLKRIKGIGPVIERRLHAAGIRTLDQLTALSPAQVATMVAGLSVRRIVHENWIGQARKLAPGPAAPSPEKDAAALRGSQHYATFTVELLLDEDNEVRRTRVMHIQNGDEDVWAGWQDTRLLDFLIQHATLRLAPIEAALPVTVAVENTSSSTVPAGLAGVLRLRRLETIPADVRLPANILRDNEPFTARLTLDLTDVVTGGYVALSYTAMIYAKPLSGGPRLSIGVANGEVRPADRVTVDIEGAGLPPGIYRLEAVAILTLPTEMPRAGRRLMAMLEGDLLQVF